MIRSLLIANRGEIACRIIRTCRRLGIRTVAVFSAADAQALHVDMADERHCIGPADARASYLDAVQIIAAALEHQADAIHPGYGFLSERPDLPELCQQNGLVWVGPSARCIRQMGSKIAAKHIAREAGIACVPGYDGTSQSPQELLRQACEIGFPILIKASAGGGGKGIRPVWQAAEFLASLQLAQREALAAFGDDCVLLEKYIVKPRHIEVQLVGDKLGNLIHLHERECSIQRSFQKIIEEAPAPNVAPRVREKLFGAAVRIGRMIGYDSLGTVEFLLDADPGEDAEPYFLEVNTRLQVEHPVTEAITGLDLIELQVRIACGEALPFTQSQVAVHGVAIEARVTAEDPQTNYSPQIGQIYLYREPRDEGIRIDTGIRDGSQVTPYYDSLLAKVIASGPDRSTAAQRLVHALNRLVILGVGTNVAFLREIVSSAQFLGGSLTTRFIPEMFPNGFADAKPDPLICAAAAIAASLPNSTHVLATSRTDTPWRQFQGLRLLARAGHPSRAHCSVGGSGLPETHVELTLRGSNRFTVSLLDQHFDLRMTPLQRGFDLQWGQRIERFYCHRQDDEIFLSCSGRAAAFCVRPALETLAARVKGRGTERPYLAARLAGTIVSIDVAVGDPVEAGQTVIVMEAMKLVHTLTAPLAGTVKQISCARGQVVASGTRLVEIEPACTAHPASSSPDEAAQ